MRPILFKGHERPLTVVKFNPDGDLLFTAAKDGKAVALDAQTGEMIGSYDGHQGGIWDLDPSWDSKFLISAGSDQKAILFELETGKELMSFEHSGSVRSVAFNTDARKFVTAADKFGTSHLGAIAVFEVNHENPALSSQAPSKRWELPTDVQCTRVAWIHFRGKLDGGIIATYDDGSVRILDPETGNTVLSAEVHSKTIKRFSLNHDKTLLFTASDDHTAKMLDTDTLEVLQNYQTDRPVNAIVPHPSKDHVILGGGQDAMSVTTTAGAQGKFDARFFEMIYTTEFARVKGHFGPINDIAVNPNGRSFVSGGEDGFVRLQHFDQDYLEKEDPVPEENIEDIAARAGVSVSA